MVPTRMVPTALAALFLIGCGGGSGDDPPPPPPPVTDTTAPSVPAGVTAASQSAKAILVSWTASTDASGVGGYRVFRNGGAAPVATVTATNYTDSGLTAATVYSYTVVAFDAATPANVSTASAAASATTTGVTPPPPVGGLDSRPANTSCLAGDPANVPALLSQTGCVNPTNPAQPAAGLIPFALNAPFFSDGAVKTRWLALPDGQRIVIGDNNDFDFPNGSVLMKNFRLGTTLVETRLFMRHNDGAWAGYTYEWNASGTEATRVVGGKTVQIAGQTWEFPSEAQCQFCHSAAAGHTLGPEMGQLNGDFGYLTTGRTANQLTTLNAIDALTPALTAPPAQLPAISKPFGSEALGLRARAYLHGNCSDCHRPGGPAPTSIDFRYTTPLSAMNTCDITPTRGNLGISDPRIIAPGSAERSIVVARVNRVGADAMPPIGRHMIDTAGVALLTEWVNGLTSCN